MARVWVGQYIPIPWPRERHGNQVWPVTQEFSSKFMGVRRILDSMLI